MKTQLIHDENNLPFAFNPDNRCPTVLILDSSYSMTTNGRIDKLNNGLQRLMQDINLDVLAKRRIDLAVVQCNNSAPKLVQPMVTVQDIVESSPLPTFTASGGTPMDEALLLGLKVVKEHKATLKQNGIQYYKAMIFVLSDGEFHVSQETLTQLHQLEECNGHAMFAIGVGKDASAEDLAAISAKGRAFLLDDTHFADLFEFMSSSLASVSQSSPGDKLSVAIPDSMKIVERQEIEL